jgi:hypothetical protein
MLLRTSAPAGPRRPLPTLAGLLALAVLAAGVGLTGQAAPVPRKDEPTKTDSPKDATKKDEIGKDKIIPDDTKKPSPNAVPDQAKQMREDRARMLQRMGPPVAGGYLPGGGMPYPGFMDPRSARLGARVEPPGETLSEQLDLPKGRGLVVREVLPDSAAAKAGLKRHDVLLELNGKPVPDQIGGLVQLMNDIKADAKVDAVVVRKGKKETIKGLSLPEAKAFAPGFNLAPPGQGGAGFPPPAGAMPPGGINANFAAFMPPGGQTVLTTMFRTPDRFTLRHQEGNLVITLTGKVADGKAKVNEINVQDGLQTYKYESLDKVPQQYHDKAKNLIEMSEKGNAQIEIKTP